MAGGEGCAGRSSFVKTRPGDGSGAGEAVFEAGLAARFARATSASDRARGEGEGEGLGLGFGLSAVAAMDAARTVVAASDRRRHVMRLAYRETRPPSRDQDRAARDRSRAAALCSISLASLESPARSTYWRYAATASAMLPVRSRTLPRLR
jgi:hypothetical protein